ncbi:MAG: hypothetical protein ABIT58_08045 [Ferruginibacter sp.]
MPHEELNDTIFPGNSGASNPKELLQKVANEFPYFALPHFFLLKETAPTDFNYRKIAAKTAMHFNNPFLLKYQLLKKDRVDVTEAEVEDLIEVERLINEPPGTEDDFEVDKVENVLEIARAEEVQEVIKPGIPGDVREVEKLAEIQKNDVPPETAENVIHPDKKEELLFEPLHTTDYFASQGIKLSEEAQTADKLGKQLKSFTEWLKTMKKKGQGRLPETNTAIDTAVQNLAEKSNKEQEVLTEAMAEVYLQQGKMGKAREIYKKLSLLNPAKSAYFAAKIELLKEK